MALTLSFNLPVFLAVFFAGLFVLTFIAAYRIQGELDEATKQLNEIKNDD